MPVDHDLDRSGCICVPEIWRAQIDGRIRRIPKHFPCISRNREFQAEFHRSTNIFNIRLELTLWLLLVELGSINWLGILETTGEKKEKKRKKMRSSLWKSKRGWRSFAREFRNSWNSTSLAREGCCDRQALHFCHHPASWYLSRLFTPHDWKLKWNFVDVVRRWSCNRFYLRKRNRTRIWFDRNNCTKNTTTTTTTTLSEHHQHPTATSLSASMKLNFLIYSCDTYIDIYIYEYKYKYIYIYSYIYIFYSYCFFYSCHDVVIRLHIGNRERCAPLWRRDTR